MIAPRYLSTLGILVLFWCAVYALFTLIVDPYGVSPLKLTIERVNQHRPKRVDIDRIIKPYEVWWKQPRTVFLGTSRIHQSMDPTVLDGTPWAPAYNASIPASSLGLNISHLTQYVEFDPQLRTVFVELFLYNFLGQGQERAPKQLSEFVRSSATLFVSGDTLWASVQTLIHNLMGRKPVHEIKAGGFFYYPPGHDAKGPFDGFAAGIWKLHASRADGFKLHEPAFESVLEIIELCRRNKLEVIFVLTPNHAYDDYYLDQVGAWDVVEQWLARLAGVGATVVSFSQPNPWVYEPVANRMRYWNDPYHFSLELGKAMQLAMAGNAMPGSPDNLMVRLTPDKVAEHIAQRRDAVRLWAQGNPEFVATFQKERAQWERELARKK